MEQANGTNEEKKDIVLMIPLDGSHMAEAALAIAEPIASHCKAKIILLHVIEKGARPSIHGEKHLTNVEEAEKYLSDISQRLETAGITVDTHVHPNKEGDVAKSIVEHAREMNPNLVVMCTHGHGGIRDIIFGNIAQQTLRKGTWPILLVPPKISDKASSIVFNRILLPLDGMHGHEKALNIVIPIACAFKAELRLLLVIPTQWELAGEQGLMSRFLPTATRAVLDLAVQGAKEYLIKIIEQCQNENISAKAEVLRGNTVAEVLDHADKIEADLIVLSSHGRAGLDALLSGSIAPRIMGKAGRPLLLVKSE